MNKIERQKPISERNKKNFEAGGKIVFSDNLTVLTRFENHYILRRKYKDSFDMVVKLSKNDGFDLLKKLLDADRTKEGKPTHWISRFCHINYYSAEVLQ